MTDPIKEALANVDEKADADDPGAGLEAMGEEPDARPEGPAPDLDATDGVQEETGARSSVLSWAKRVPEGTHLDFDRRDWWDPENGAENRLAFHLSDATGEGVGYPNGVGILVAFGELYWSRVRDPSRSGGDDSEAELEDDGEAIETADRDTAEALV